MTVTCDYANPNDTSMVNYHFDADSMTVMPSTDKRVLDFVASGGVIGPYVAPAAPPSNTTLDQFALNDALAAPGSVFRGLALTVLDLATGKIPINPNYTQAQLVAAIQQRMR